MTEAMIQEVGQGELTPASDRQTEKDIKRRKRFDPALDRMVSPDERDEIRAYMARHGQGRYPPKYAKEVAEAEARKASMPRKSNTVGAVAKPASVPKPGQIPDSGTAVFVARMFAADLAKAINDQVAILSPEIQLKAMEVMEKKFLEYKNK